MNHEDGIQSELDKTEKKICIFCGAVFKERVGKMGRKKKYCSTNCRWRAWDKRHPRIKTEAYGKVDV
jgi:hypothetical protein